jgi:hypothetical protein
LWINEFNEIVYLAMCGKGLGDLIEGGSIVTRYFSTRLSTGGVGTD